MSKPASLAIDWITCARRWASEVVVVMSVKLGLVMPACLSSAFAFATSRLGMGTDFAYQAFFGDTHWLPASACSSITTSTIAWRSSESSKASRTRGSRTGLFAANSLLATLKSMPW
jgi:hypothetical protein